MLARKAKASILIIIICLTGIMTVFAEETITKPVISGDLNSDDKIDAVDLYYMQKYILGFDVDISLLAIDMDSNGTVDAVDLYYLQKYILGFSVVVGKTVTIEFNSDGGTSVSSAVTSIGMTLEELPEATLEGKSFAGWYDGDALITTDTVFTEDMTVKAKWE
ncbi:MAG: dockerin type I domain-containing protein [Clostridia bacterium]